MFSQASVCPQMVGISGPMSFLRGGYIEGIGYIQGGYVLGDGYVQGEEVSMFRG